MLIASHLNLSKNPQKASFPFFHKIFTDFFKVLLNDGLRLIEIISMYKYLGSKIVQT